MEGGRGLQEEKNYVSTFIVSPEKSKSSENGKFFCETINNRDVSSQNTRGLPGEPAELSNKNTEEVAHQPFATFTSLPNNLYNLQ